MRRPLIAVIAAQVTVAAMATAVAAADGPHLVRGGSSGLSDAYVDTHYAFSYVLETTSSFVVRDAAAVRSGDRCDVALRLLPTEPGWGAGKPVRDGSPGAALVGSRLTPQSDRRVVVVITSHTVGRCVVTQLRVARRSWGRERWATLPVRLVLGIRHAHGVDPRFNE